MMSWTDSNENQSQPLPEDPSNVQIFQQSAPQPTTIFQQFSAAVTSSFAPVRSGHIREDLVELMMIQNAQMHQIIMNNMSMSALNTFNYTHTPEPLIQAPPPDLQEPPQHAQQVYTKCKDRKDVPPPPPPSAQTVGADIPLTPEFYATERWQ